ncbi:MAG: bacterial transcriptional activator domain-containing protein [Muricomes sp.]
MNNEGKESSTLQVKMFGNFSMMYDGKSLLGKKAGGTQFALLMQILLHNGKKGVSREVLEEILFSERDLENVHHAMQSVVYNAKKKLEQSGLPKVNYITLENGIFYWTSEIEVDEDALEFEQLCREAGNETSVEQKLKILLDACHCYRGEFLSEYVGVIWAAAEARKYRSQFRNCVEEAVQLLREQKDFLQMRQLGLYAASVEAFSGWEEITMEALLEMGRHEDANRLYETTVDLYLGEKEFHPSLELMDFLDRLGAKMTNSRESLDVIQHKLESSRKNTQGGYFCSYPIFQGIYCMVARSIEREGHSALLMQCIIVDSKGNPMKEGEQLDELSERLKDAICSSIRHVDTVSEYGKGQYLVLLVDTTHKYCSIVQKRINSRFLVGRQRTGVKYHVNSVVCERDRENISKISGE